MLWLIGDGYEGESDQAVRYIVGGLPGLAGRGDGASVSSVGSSCSPPQGVRSSVMLVRNVSLGVCCAVLQAGLVPVPLRQI